MPGDPTEVYHCPACGYAESVGAWAQNGWQCRACGRYTTPDQLVTPEEYAERDEYDEREMGNYADEPVGGEGGTDDS